MKKKTGIARLFEIAGERKGLLILSGILSAGSAACMLIPYLAVYQILSKLLYYNTDLNHIDSNILIHWGWIAFIGLIIGLILLYASLMFSHVAAFRILYGLRIKLAEHLGKLSLGYLNSSSTGAIKKTMEQNIEKIETFIARTIPDLVNVTATVILMFFIFFSLNGWMATICLTCIILSIGLQFATFFGKKANEFMKTYFDTQEQMSASAVQYVRGMPIVKIFGQSVRSFCQFNEEIETYKRYALKVCDTYQPGMITFTVLLNSLVTFIIPAGLLLLSGNPENIALATVWLFFIIMGPGVASPIYKLTFLGSGTTSVVAKKLLRHYIGIEMESQYCVWAEQRLEMAKLNPGIQGYINGVFWERNSLAEQNSVHTKSKKDTSASDAQKSLFDFQGEL